MEKTDVIAALAALAQDTRLDVFRLLVQAGPGGLPAGRIGERLNLASATLSFHLKELQRAALIEVRRDGRFLYYRPNLESMNELIGFLTENCCSLADRGCAPQCQPAATEAPLPKRHRA